MIVAATPTTWPDVPPISTIHVLLFFGGIPLLVVIAVWLIISGPSMGRGSHYRPGQAWQAEPEWFAGRDDGLVESGTRSGTQLEGPATTDHDDRDTGGASATW